MFADEKQLASQADLIHAVQAAGEAGASLSLALIRGGKEMSVVVTPERRQANVANQGQGLFNGRNLQLPEIAPNDIFGEEIFGGDMFGQGIEARMMQRIERMRDRIRQFEGQILK